MPSTSRRLLAVAVLLLYGAGLAAAPTAADALELGAGAPEPEPEPEPAPPTPPAPAPGRPVPPCPEYWTQSGDACEQQCLDGGTLRDATTGRCSCGESTADDLHKGTGCLSPLLCTDGLCQVDAKDWHRFFQNPLYEFYVSCAAVALLALVGCSVQLHRTRRHKNASCLLRGT